MKVKERSKLCFHNPKDVKDCEEPPKDRREHGTNFPLETEDKCQRLDFGFIASRHVGG